MVTDAAGSDCLRSSGGGKCSSDTDCGYPRGKCMKSQASGDGLCACAPGYGCPQCNQLTTFLQSGGQCPQPLPAGDAYSNVTANVAFMPAGPGSTTIQQLKFGASIGGGVLGAIVVALTLLEVRRWHAMKKAVAEEVSRKSGKGRKKGGGRGRGSATGGDFVGVRPDSARSGESSVPSPAPGAGRESRLRAPSAQQLLAKRLDSHPDVGRSLGLSPKNSWRVRHGAVLPAERLSGDNADFPN